MINIRKMILMNILIFSLVCLIADGTLPNGSGTEEDPYQIECLDNLLWVSTNPDSWNSDFIQINDIDASETLSWNNGEGFSPIGRYTDYNNTNPFRGSYDGLDHSIFSLHIARPDSIHQALFGYSDHGHISNLHFLNTDILGSNWVGCLIGYGIGLTITNCSTSGSVIGHSNVGGLAGRIDGSHIYSCINECEVNGESAVGGLIGLGHGTLHDSYNKGYVNGLTNYGGLAGYSELQLDNSFYNKDIVLINGTSVNSPGAISGELYNVWIDNELFLDIDSYLSDYGNGYEITSISDLKKLCAFGQFDHTFILENDLDLINETDFYIPYFKGTFNGNNKIISNLNLNMIDRSFAGFIGQARDSTIHDLNLQNIDVDGWFYVGGLIGYSPWSNISNCNVNGEIFGFTRDTGGLVGVSRYTIMENCSFGGSVQADAWVGGLIGRIYQQSEIYSCNNSAEVIGNQSVGGIVGNNIGTSLLIESSSNIGFITSSEGSAGGILGNNFWGEVSILNCLNTGSISGTNSGGILGFSLNECQINNSFWNTENTEATSCIGGSDVYPESGKTFLELQDIATFTDLSTEGLDTPWDFVGNPFDDNQNEDIWDIDTNINNGYPFLTNIEYVSAQNQQIESVSQAVPKLLGNYPNPFNPSTNIRFSLPEKAKVKITIYNVKGQKVIELTDKRYNSGAHSIIWNGKDDNYKQVSSGVYLYKLDVDNKYISTKKCILMK